MMQDRSNWRPLEETFNPIAELKYDDDDNDYLA